MTVKAFIEHPIRKPTPYDRTQPLKDFASTGLADLAVEIPVQLPSRRHIIQRGQSFRPVYDHLKAVQLLSRNIHGRQSYNQGF